MLKQTQIRMAFLFAPLLFLINIVSKSIFLTAADIGLDEPFSIYHAQFGFQTIIEHLKNYNNPPLFELLMHVWIKLFGNSPLSVRTLPLISASLCPVALFYFCRQNFSLKIAVISSLLLSSSSLLFFYAQDCRVYSLFMLLTILSMSAFLNLLNNRGKAGFYIILNVSLLYAHYFGIFVIFFQFVFLLMYHRQKTVKFTSYQAFVFVLYLPQIYSLTTRLHDSVENGTWVNAPTGAESLYNMLWSFSNAPVVTVLCLLILFSGC